MIDINLLVKPPSEEELNEEYSKFNNRYQQINITLASIIGLYLTVIFWFRSNGQISDLELNLMVAATIATAFLCFKLSTFLPTPFSSLVSFIGGCGFYFIGEFPTDIPSQLLLIAITSFAGSGLGAMFSSRRKLTVERKQYLPISNSGDYEWINKMAKYSPAITYYLSLVKESRRKEIYLAEITLFKSHIKQPEDEAQQIILSSAKEALWDNLPLK